MRVDLTCLKAPFTKTIFLFIYHLWEILAVYCYCLMQPIPTNDSDTTDTIVKGRASLMIQGRSLLMQGDQKPIIPIISFLFVSSNSHATTNAHH